MSTLGEPIDLVVVELPLGAAILLGILISAAFLASYKGLVTLFYGSSGQTFATLVLAAAFFWAFLQLEWQPGLYFAAILGLAGPFLKFVYDSVTADKDDD